MTDEDAINALSAVLSYVRGIYAIRVEAGTYDHSRGVGVELGFHFMLRLLARHPEYVAILASAQCVADAKYAQLAAVSDPFDALGDQVVARFLLSTETVTT